MSLFLTIMATICGSASAVAFATGAYCLSLTNALLAAGFVFLSWVYESV